MTDPEDIPPIRESLREGLRHVETVVGTWMYLTTWIWISAAMLVSVAGHPRSAILLPLAAGATFVLSVVATATTLRYRPDATNRLGTFVIASGVVFVGVCVVVLPGSTSGSVALPAVYAVPIVLLGWLVSVAAGYAIAYRRAHAALRQWLASVGDR